MFKSIHVIPLILSLFCTTVLCAQPPEKVQNYMVNKINDIRVKGCKCGGKYMKPVKPVVWNDLLFITALDHAKDMDRYNYFGHISKKGLDIGDRMDKRGYNWKNAGENLGEGQKYFEEVVQDWIESPSHCRMIMHPDMREMGIAKHENLWVQHFGCRIPENHKRINKRYYEGN